jgi:lysophospholipase L1-like esterase
MKMKMQKILAAALSVCMSLTVFAGCGSSDSSSSSESKADTSAAADSTASGDESTADTTAETEDVSAKLLEEYPVNDGAYDVSQGATENMLARAILNEGDTSRLAEKLDYAINNPKELTTVCFLGDSITAGSGAVTSTNTFVNQFKTWWEDNISYFVQVDNAGIGATDSYIGVHRAQRDCISLNADIIVIEFINDADNEFYQSCMDSLVRMCLEQENNPAVIILEPSCEDGSSPQAAHLKVAQEYDIPMISYHDAVYPEIDAGNFTWADVSPDTVHPNDNGHIIMAQCITNLCQKVIDQLDTIDKVSKPFDTSIVSSTGDVFANATLGSRETTDIIKTTDEGSFTEEASFQQFSGGWKTETGGSITFEITARNIGLMYKKTTDGNTGMVSIKVDGEEVATIDGDFPNGWGNYAKADSVYTSDETATHEVTVTVVDGDAQNFEILNWLIS